MFDHQHPADAMAEYAAKLAPAAREKLRLRDRRAYIRQHAPTIMIAMASNPVRWPDDVRKAAIQQAGLLYDETEASTDG